MSPLFRFLRVALFSLFLTSVIAPIGAVDAEAKSTRPRVIKVIDGMVSCRAKRLKSRPGAARCLKAMENLLAEYERVNEALLIEQTRLEEALADATSERAVKLRERLEKSRERSSKFASRSERLREAIVLVYSIIEDPHDPSNVQRAIVSVVRAVLSGARA